jgi:hypothetical protein
VQRLHSELPPSVVDLPGLISVPNEEQTELDVQTVHNLVDSCVANPRTIILAVVQAGNDIANQAIIQKSRYSIKVAGEQWESSPNLTSSTQARRRGSTSVPRP